MKVGLCCLICFFLSVPSLAQSLDAQPDVHLNRGVSRENDGDCEEAVTHFSEVLRHDRNNAMAYEHRAQCYYQLGKFTAAIRDLQKAERIVGQASASRLHLLADCYIATDQSVDALQCLDRLMLMNRDDKEARFKRGFVHVKTRNYPQAITDLEWVREQGESTIKLYLSLAEAYIGIGNRAAAISAFDDAVDLDPDNANVWFNRGLLHEGEKDYESAIVDYNKVLRLDPTDVDALYNRASCKGALGDFGAALSDMNEAIRLDPSNAAYYKQRGNFYYRLNQKEKACFDWRRAVEHGDAKARFQLNTYCK